MWYGVGSVTPYSNLGPIGNELATLSDSNIFEQRYVGTSPATLGVGASDSIGEQILTVTCDTGTVNVYTPALSNVKTNMRLYVAKDGSTYHSRADHNYSTWPNGPDLSTQQALQPQHLAKASPTYQQDCYNTAEVTYGSWMCQNTTTKTRNKTVTGKSYNSSTLSCDTDATPIVTAETENCASGSLCGNGTCSQLPYTVDDNFDTATANFGTYNFNSIQAAADAVPAQSTININPGIYTGNTIVAKTLTLEGVSANQVILDGGSSGNVLTLTGTGGTVSGLTVRNSGQGSDSPGNIGIFVNPTSAPSGSAYTIKNSVIYGNGKGIALWNGSNAQVTVQNNMIFRNLQNGISNDGFGQSTIINNTISDNGDNGYYDWVGKGPHTVKNNIIVNNGKYGFVTHRDSTPRTLSYNNVWNNPSGNYVEAYTAYTTLAPSPGTGNMAVDPLFTNRTNADYSLSSSSPLKTKGEAGADMGSNIIIGTTSLSPLTTSSSAPTYTQTGLIGYWKFDGNGNNEISGSPSAVLVGNSSFKTSGGKYEGYGYVPANTDWIKIPYNSMFDMPISFSIEFWFRQRSNQSSSQNLVYKGNATNNYNFYIFRQLWNQYNYGPVISGFTSSKTGYWTQTSNGNQLAHSEWHHVVFTKDGSQSAYYLDGIPIHSASQTDSAVTPAADIIIGDSALDTDFDNLRIYNRSLNISEVLANGGFPPQSTVQVTIVDTTSNSSGTGEITNTIVNTTPQTTQTETINTSTGAYYPVYTNIPITYTPDYTAQGSSTALITTSSSIQLVSGATISPVLLRTLEADGKILDDFETFLQELQSRGSNTNALTRAYDLIAEGRYYVGRINEALNSGDQKIASRRLGYLNGIIGDINSEWERLTYTFQDVNVSVSLPTYADNNETLVKDELKNYAIEEIAEKITQLIIGKINYTDILNQIVQQLQQNKSVVDKLFQYTDKHETEVSKTMDLLVTVDESHQEDYLSSKVNVLEKIDVLDEVTGKLSLQKTAMDQLNSLKEKIMGYNFVGPQAEQVLAKLADLSAQLGGNNQTPESVENQLDAFSADLEKSIQESTEYKFEQEYIPFKDTDDQYWFTQYVAPIKESGIISGYKDTNGNELGEFGPANNMTVAEILKIALEASQLGQGDPNQAPASIKNHWAAGYVVTGKEKGLTLMKHITSTADLDRPVTRAEVLRVLIESFGVTLIPTDAAPFKDTDGHIDQLFIATAKELGIVNGYDDGTFKPNNPVNRAEVAKIVNLAMSNF